MIETEEQELVTLLPKNINQLPLTLFDMLWVDAKVVCHCLAI